MHLIIYSLPGREQTVFPHFISEKCLLTLSTHALNRWREMPTYRYGIKLSQREAGAVLSYKWACESQAIYLNNIPLSLVFYPSHFWLLSATMGKSFRPPSMQMQHTRAARGITSKLDDFLKVGMHQASVFFQAAWKKHDLAQALALQLSSNLS